MKTLSSLIASYLETDEYEKQLSPDAIIPIRFRVPGDIIHIFIVYLLNLENFVQFKKYNYKKAPHFHVKPFS